VPRPHRGDAIGDSPADARRAFARGARGRLVRPRADEDSRRRALYGQWGGRPHDSYPPYRCPAATRRSTHRGRRVLLHHNITPPESSWHRSELARICAIGQGSSGLAPYVDLGLPTASSTAVAGEAASAYGVFHLPRLARYRERPTPCCGGCSRRRPTSSSWAASRQQPQDLVRLASYWRRFISPTCGLLLVASSAARSYYDALQSFFYEEASARAEVVFTATWTIGAPRLLRGRRTFGLHERARGLGCRCGGEANGGRCSRIDECRPRHPRRCGRAVHERRVDEVGDAHGLVTTPSCGGRPRRAARLPGLQPDRGASLKATWIALDGGPAGARDLRSSATADVTGGSETWPARGGTLPQYRSRAHHVARDYVTGARWPRDGADRDVDVTRFRVEEERDLEPSNRFSRPSHAAPPPEEELDWLRRQGPYVPALVRELKGARSLPTLDSSRISTTRFWAEGGAGARCCATPTSRPSLRVYGRCSPARAFAFPHSAGRGSSVPLSAGWVARGWQDRRRDAAVARTAPFVPATRYRTHLSTPPDRPGKGLRRDADFYARYQRRGSAGPDCSSSAISP